MSRWIVCGVAGGSGDVSTLSVASRLTDCVGGRLAIVHAVRDTGEPGALHEQLDSGGRLIVAAVRNSVVADDAVHRVELGEPAAGLTRVAAELEAALIVVGATQRSVILSFAGGGVPDRLITSAGRPVVVVPEGAHRAFRAGTARGGSVVCGLDGVDGPRLASYTESFAHDLGVRPVTGEPSQMLELVAEREHACAIVVSSRGGGRLSRALRGSALPRGATRPVVVLPAAERMASAT